MIFLQLTLFRWVYGPGGSSQFLGIYNPGPNSHSDWGILDVSNNGFYNAFWNVNYTNQPMIPGQYIVVSKHMIHQFQ